MAVAAALLVLGGACATGGAAPSPATTVSAQARTVVLDEGTPSSVSIDGDATAPASTPAGGQFVSRSAPAVTPAAKSRPVVLLAPARGSPCPTATVICDAATTIAAAFKRGDAATILGMSAPVGYICPAPGQGAPTTLCAGATPGELRMGYFVSRTGEPASAEDTYTAEVAGWVARAAAGIGTDSYGDGGIEVASVGCVPTPDARCREDVIIAAFTFITNDRNVARLDPTAGVSRTVVYVNLHSESGVLRIHGIGQSAPLEALLVAGSTPVSLAAGAGTLGWRPWRP
ncbi:MAG: hypothetical protein HYX53_09695 [Chloroflexi bacterium]|nr:hypothetical protein [Chloroflexota bacterium]